MNADLLFIGLIFVGLILTVKVTTDGLRQLNEQKIKLNQFQAATEQCQLKMTHEAEEVNQLEKDVKQQEQDYASLSDKEKSLQTQVRDLEQKLPKRPRAKVG
ncbi:MAG: hypothetical protein ACO36I_09010 [Candidatus Latescibacterota bacterium]|jgi:septal ring factor EnvC (AmiA/AmiB activator)